MAERDDGYGAIIRAVHGRWRRRFLLLAHAIICIAIGMQIAYTTAITTMIHDHMTGAKVPYTYTRYTTVFQTPPGQIWAVILVLHFLYVLFAGLRDRAVRKEIERERKWRILEGLEEWAQPDMRERVVRLAEARDGELIDFDSATWEANVTNGKRKRG
jgi:hypothetical protein